MTIQEFSDQFDVLFNSSSTLKPNGIVMGPEALDEYEKSVFLTQAQKAFVEGVYNGLYKGESFEETEEARRALDSLIVTAKPEVLGDVLGLTDRSSFYQMPDDLWFITYESAKLEDSYCGNEDIQVIPVRQDEFHKTESNPFRGSGKRRVLRLDAGGTIAELVSRYPVKDYLIRYIRKPKPIILTRLEQLSIDGYSEPMGCELDPGVHFRILESAVYIASSRYGMASNAQNQGNV